MSVCIMFHKCKLKLIGANSIWLFYLFFYHLLLKYTICKYYFTISVCDGGDRAWVAGDKKPPIGGT